MRQHPFVIIWVLLGLIIGVFQVQAQNRATARSITVYKTPT